MARRTFDHVLTLGKGRTDIDGSFLTNGSSNPATKHPAHGCGVASIAHTSTGKYTLTLEDAYNETIKVHAHLSMNSPDGSYAQAMPIAAGATTAIIYTLNSVGAVVDIAAHANNAVNYTFKFKNSSARV